MSTTQTRTELLRSALSEQVDGTLFVLEPPSNAGLYFAELGRWRVLVQPEHLLLMADALSDEDFPLFLEALVELCRNVLALATDEDELDQTIFDAQHLTAQSKPAAYAVLDSVFYLGD